MANKKIFWKLQDNVLDEQNKKDLIKFIKSTDRFTQFTQVKKFEREWSTWQRRKYSVFVNSGSSAILILFSALKELYEWEEDSEVIVPAVTWITDISSLLQLHLKPIFIDVNLTDLSFKYEDIESKITNKTKAIFPTHLLGFPSDVSKILKIIRKRKILLIEDCCEANGAYSRRKKVGNFGHASVFSFYWGHHITSIEGGMICTDNEQLYNLLLLKRSHGLARELPKKLHKFYKDKYKDIDFKFLFLTCGYNVRNTELNAVLGISQLTKQNQFIKVRNKNYANFIKLLKPYSKHIFAPNVPGVSSFCLPFILKSKLIKAQLQKYLAQNGIETRPIISGNLLRQPFLKKKSEIKQYKTAEYLHHNAFYIGNNQFVNDDKLNTLNNLLNIFFSKVKE